MKKLTISVVLMLAFLLLVPQVMKAQDWSLGGTYVLASAKDNLQIAELTLAEIAERDGISRKITGYSLIAGGAGIAVLGVLLDEPDVLPICMVVGGVVAGSGVLVLALPTSSEREYAKIVKIKDPEEREYRAEKSLSYLATQARQARIISGIMNTGLAMYYLYKFSQDDELFYDDTDVEGMELYYAVALAGSAIYGFLVPSYVEKAYEEVREAKAAKVGFQIGKFTGFVATVSF